MTKRGGLRWRGREDGGGFEGACGDAMMAPRRGFFLAQRRPRVGALTRGSLAHLHNTDDTWVFSRFAGGCVSLVSAFFSGKNSGVWLGRSSQGRFFPAKTRVSGSGVPRRGVFLGALGALWGPRAVFWGPWGPIGPMWGPWGPMWAHDQEDVPRGPFAGTVMACIGPTSEPPGTLKRRAVE